VTAPTSTSVGNVRLETAFSRPAARLRANETNGGSLAGRVVKQQIGRSDAGGRLALCEASYVQTFRNHSPLLVHFGVGRPRRKAACYRPRRRLTAVKRGSISCESVRILTQASTSNMYTQDVRIAYMDVAPEGSANGRTVVLLHGNNLGGFCQTDTTPLRRQRFRVIVADQIGYGRSSKPVAAYNFNSQARASATQAVPSSAESTRWSRPATSRVTEPCPEAMAPMTSVTDVHRLISRSGHSLPRERRADHRGVAR
jgi:hypothetical protein